MSLPPPKSKRVRTVRPRSIQANQPGSVRTIGDRTVRVDAAETAIGPVAVDLDVALAERTQATGSGGAVDQSQAADPVGHYQEASARDWLTYHASDLIDRLTHWADDLSVREANLNARQAMWERQARRLRLQFQEAQFEIDEIEARLHQAQKRVAEQEEQLRITACQLAIARF